MNRKKGPARAGPFSRFQGTLQERRRKMQFDIDSGGEGLYNIGMNLKCRQMV